MKLLFLCLLLVSMSISAAADNEKQIAVLEIAVMRLQQEQQNLFQQFQMLQELRRHEIAQSEQALSAEDGIITSGEAPSYGNITKQRKERTERIRRYTDELEELHVRYQETENERRALIEQVNGLKPGNTSTSSVESGQ